MNKEYLHEISDIIKASLKSNEIFLCHYQGEKTDFIRFNQAKIRQSTHVTQNNITITLIDNKKSAAMSVYLSLNKNDDAAKIKNIVIKLREIIQITPDDPYLSYNKNINSTCVVKANELMATDEIVDCILKQCNKHDLVGILTNGSIYEGFINSFGQNNWFESHSCNFDFSLYLDNQKAVKQDYCDESWSNEKFIDKWNLALQQLELLKIDNISLKPKSYRAYLSPMAVYQLILLLSWNGFGLKNSRLRHSPLIKLQQGHKKLNQKISISENIKLGIGANFDTHGFIKPDNISLISNGQHDNFLVSPKSALEFNEVNNAANASEGLTSVAMQPGNLSQKTILSDLHTGIFISNLWYLNYSNNENCGITGMTRYACYFVEGGKIKAPFSSMRFDDSIYNMFGDNLIDLTKERDFLIDNDSYGRRNNNSALLPGALIDDLSLTL